MHEGRLFARALLRPDHPNPSRSLARRLCLEAGAGHREVGADALIDRGQGHPLLQGVRRGAVEVLERAEAADQWDALARHLRRDVRAVRAEAIMGRPALLRITPTMQAEAGGLDRAVLVELGRQLAKRDWRVEGAERFEHLVAEAIQAVTGARASAPGEDRHSGTGTERALAWLDRNLESHLDSLNGTLAKAKIKLELRFVPLGFELPALPAEVPAPPPPARGRGGPEGAGDGALQPNPFPTHEATSWLRGLQTVEDAFRKNAPPMLIGFVRWVRRLVQELSALADELTPGLRRWLVLRV